jgi:hypothetical protein
MLGAGGREMMMMMMIIIISTYLEKQNLLPVEQT